MLPRLSPLPIKERTSVLFLERGRLDVLDGAFVLVDQAGVRTHVPVGSVACLMLEPGTRVSHAAVALAARVGCLLVWVGEAGVRLYASGQPGGARSDKLLYQAALALDEQARLRVVRKMFEVRFGEPAPERRSVEQLRGVEGARVRAMYQMLARQFGVPWKGRRYDPKDWDAGDAANRCLSAATACLYGVTEAAVLAAGYAPAIGFVHSGKPLSFVYDIADLFKFETVAPQAFAVAKRPGADVEGEVRRRCRDAFRRTRLLQRIIPAIEDVLSAGGIPRPAEPDWVQPVAFADEEGLGDDGHRA
ncbi:MAG: type I-E CRISPR-associated endonuclease Cas1e [Desulfovibrionaceae bacterium]